MRIRGLALAGLVVTAVGWLPAKADPAGLIALTLTGPTNVIAESGTGYLYNGKLTAGGLAGLQGQKIELLIDGTVVASVMTNNQGSYTIPRAFPQAGVFQLQTVAYRGTVLETGSAPLTVTAVKHANLQVIASATTPGIPVGETGSFSVNVHNLGPSSATDVQLEMALTGPGDVSSVSAQHSTCTFTTSSVSCSLVAPLASGQTKAFQVYAIGKALGQIALTAVASSATEDPEPGNNVSMAIALGRPAIGFAVLNEIDYDQPDGDFTDIAEYVEIKGPPGASMQGFALIFGNSTVSAEYYRVPIGNYAIGSNGYLVVAGPAVVLPPGTTRVSMPANSIRTPSASVALFDLVGNRVYDALSYTGGNQPMIKVSGVNQFYAFGEGTMTGSLDTGDGSVSVGRIPNGTDTNSNLADWKKNSLTPGADNAPLPG